MENLKTIMTFTLPQDAYLARSLLESEGIETFIQDELTAQVINFYSNAIGGVKLQVRESDIENGITILKNGGFINSENTRELEVELIKLKKLTNKEVCPFCNSRNIGKKKEANILTVVVYFMLGIISPIFKKSYVCYDCEKLWKYVKR